MTSPQSSTSATSSTTGCAEPELQQHFDVEIRHGVLSMRREITDQDPSMLASWIDLAADGARTVVRQAAAGYRD